MDFNNLKKKLDKENLTIDDVVVFFAFKNIKKYRKNFVSEIIKKLNIDVRVDDLSNQKIINIFDGNIEIDFLTTFIEKMLSDEERKKSGSFYTVPSVVKHMVNQTLKLILLKKIGSDEILSLFDKEDIDEYLHSQTKFSEVLISSNLNKEIAKKIFKIITEIEILEPSSGAGTFLYYIIKYMNNVASKLALAFNFEYSVGKIIKNIYANDINSRSLSLSKLIAVHFLISESIITLTSNIKSISKNWTEGDFVIFDEEKKYDIIIGNPPYLEIKNSKYFSNESNLYSIFMRKSLELINEGGVISFVIPNSFQTTPKYEKLRDDFKANSELMIIESYNDRPSSLFSGVHQRLNIVFFTKGEGSSVYTTSHMYHRKHESKDMFENISYYKNNTFYKFSSEMDEEIYRKISSNKLNIMMLNDENGIELLISSRLGLWPKSFVEKYQSKEVMKFKVNKDYIYALNAIFNSTTFYFFWVMTSDTWHVTKGNLSIFKFSDTAIKSEKLNELGKKLMVELEKSKKFVNTTQVLYEYKHRLHKDLIDEIDKEIMKIFKLNTKQYNRIIKFAEEYRIAKWRS